MAKNNRPEIDNPLANIGLDEIVRGITAPDKGKETDVDANEIPDAQKEGKRHRVAIWLPKEVKKRLELIRVNANRNIPLRSLAAAIIMTYIEENEDVFNEL